jgi:hypothetical protein
MCSACSGSVISPTAAVGMLASVRLAVVKGSLWMAPPDETSMRSTPSVLS